MSDHNLIAVLTFSLLAAGTAAIGSEMFNTRHADAAPTQVVTLPTVTITKQRDATTRLAVETQASEPRRMQ